MTDELKLPDPDSLLVRCCRIFQKFCACGRAAQFLCDWKVPSRKSGTCDAPICTYHAKQVAPGKHLCPLHQKHYDDWKKRNPDRKFSAEEQLALFGEAA